MNKKIFINISGFISVFTLTIFLPLMFFIYLPYFHLFELKNIKRVESIGLKKAEMAVNELYGYFRHENQLTLKDWTLKEKNHLHEVRNLFDTSIPVAGFCFLFLVLFGKWINYKKIFMYNLILMILLLIILSYDFTFFWKNLFHPLFFKNSDWINNVNDLSYYIMPRNFFKKIMFYSTFASIMLNIIYLLQKKYELRYSISPK